MMKLTRQTHKQLFKWIARISSVITIASFFTGLFGDRTAFSVGTVVLLIAILSYAISQGTGESFVTSFRNISTLNVEQAAAQLQGQHSSDRVKSIEALFVRLPSSISGQEVSMLLEDMFSSDPVKAIRILKPKIRDPLSLEEVETVLGGAFSSDRTKIVHILNANE